MKEETPKTVSTSFLLKDSRKWLTFYLQSSYEDIIKINQSHYTFFSNNSYWLFLTYGLNMITEYLVEIIQYLDAIMYTSSNTYRRILPKNLCIPRSHRIHGGSYDETLWGRDGFRYRKERLLNFCSYIVCSIHFRLRWIELVCILLQLRYNFHRNLDS